MSRESCESIGNDSWGLLSGIFEMEYLTDHQELSSWSMNPLWTSAKKDFKGVWWVM